MNNIIKERSPFYPGQPIPADLFVGRGKEIDRLRRSIRQVELGKPQAIFLTGEYGIGKSSLAGYTRLLAEKYNNILGLHVLLGGTESLDELASKTVESAINSQAYTPSNTEKFRNILAKYIGKQELFGVSLNFEALRADAPSISKGYLPFIRGIYGKFREDGIKGIMLIFDEINGICNNPKFSHFIKSLVDENGLSPEPIPIMLVLSGVEDRMREMIKHHEPVARIFDIVKIEPMSQEEMITFFAKSFESVNLSCSDQAMEILCRYSAGFPKMMHIIGDSTFWINNDNVIDQDDAIRGVLLAAEEVGKKFFDQQVLKVLRSAEYHSILEKLGKDQFDMAFKKNEIEKGLSEAEKRKFVNFLQRMKKLNVLRSGELRGEYTFNNRLVRLYVRLRTIKNPKK